ncbi:hypothetical protein PDL71_01895 [Lacibacter sp. MH-610]|uniref:hypothetical protein n=1 Tax=Lacibacter sp. MH-610 TaxID=3020883 RepID=UPI00389248CC
MAEFAREIKMNDKQLYELLKDEKLILYNGKPSDEMYYSGRMVWVRRKGRMAYTPILTSKGYYFLMDLIKNSSTIN